MAAIPLLWPSTCFAADVWLAWPQLVDPINRELGHPSLSGDLEGGGRGRTSALLAAGLACGVVWEASNAIATARWSCTVPFLGELKPFEMPVLAPFALAVFTLYVLVRGFLPGEVPPGAAS